MKKITPMTTYISMDEKAFCLAEINATPFSLGILSDQKGMRGIHRYRFIWVNRDGKLALFREESANPVTSPPVRVLGMWEHTVGELCDIADAHSNVGLEWEIQMAKEKQGTSTLVKDLGDQIERNALMRKNHSSFGTQVKVQRNGYPESLNKEVKLRYT